MEVVYDLDVVLQSSLYSRAMIFPMNPWIQGAAAGILFVAFVFFGTDTGRFLVEEASEYTAATFFVDSVRASELKNRYDGKDEGRRIKILVVPGHDEIAWGTEYQGTKEEEITALLGEKLFRFLSTDPRLDVTLTRDRDGYDPVFEKYFKEERKEILAFAAEQKQAMGKLMKSGHIDKVENVIHGYAPGDAVVKLYGINKWANEHSFDVVLHIHFNDYPRGGRWAPGEYSGFSLYVPESQFSNAKASKAIAESIFSTLSLFYPTSSLPLESEGIIEDQELIAVGSYNSLDAASILIEYGYIYEPHIANPKLWEESILNMAYQTYLGIEYFFKGKGASDEYLTHNTTLLPFRWEEPLEKGAPNSSEVLALQAALRLEGVYPSKSDTLSECPLTGRFGECTKRGVVGFQQKHNLAETGVVDEPTRRKLNTLYSK